MTEPRDFDYDESWDAEGLLDGAEAIPDPLDEMLRSDDELMPPDPAIDERVAQQDEDLS